MQVSVSCVGLFVERFSLSPGDSIKDLRGKVEAKWPQELNSCNFSFVFAGCVLKDSASIESVGLSPTDHIVVLYSKKPQPKPATQPQVNPEIQNIMDSFMQNVPNVQVNAGAPREPEAAPAANPSTVQPTVTPEAVEQAKNLLQILLDAGFPRERSKKALLMNGMDPNAAIEWLLTHMDDPNIDVPLTQQELNQLLNKQPNQEVANCINSNKCTYCVTGPVMTPQEWFECETCNLKDGLGCCATCARVCHEGHQLTSKGIHSCFCDCGDSNPSCVSKQN
uniref:Uncharacterized protein n=1 Tax=Vannella robusta TaxID=1487602 RepID=A0A7S4HJX2_9EUKA|mmetsp:Transcript_11702/g.14566  ORF Transcript_11702/g.14566 Transcript_11702/m.14566 type:complete len:279 (+) Transcript_11702:139-975(+)